MGGVVDVFEMEVVGPKRIGTESNFGFEEGRVERNHRPSMSLHRGTGP